jgi:hypothetical protein
VRRILIATVAALLPAIWLAGATAAEPKASGVGKATAAPSSGEGATCGSFGTSVEFVKNPSEAARQALKEEKLVFVLHVSGLFEDPTLT